MYGSIYEIAKRKLIKYKAYKAHKKQMTINR